MDEHFIKCIAMLLKVYAYAAYLVLKYIKMYYSDVCSLAIVGNGVTSC